MEQPQTTKSNNTTRIILIVAAVLLVCCCACGVGVALLTGSGLNFFTNRMLVQEPAEVAQISDSIMEYDMPPGYSEQAAMNLFGMGDMVIVSDLSDTQLIAFIQMNPSLPIDSEQLKQQMIDNIGNSNTANFEQVDEWTTTIRGQQVVVQQFEGSTDEGVTMRQLTTVFDGKSGTVFVIVTGNVSTWDQDVVDDFFASIQ